MKMQIIRLIAIILLTKTSTAYTQSIEFTTAKEMGETITLKIWTKRADENTVWIDFNNNKQEDDYEHIRLSPFNWDLSRAHAEIKFFVKNQVFRVYGKVTRLECTSEKITKLSIFHNSLDFLDCSYNLLTTLDVTGQPSLERLRCIKNKLTTLDVSQNKKLRYLECNKNQLTTLDLSQNKELDELNCGQNQLTELDVSQNKKLDKLRCLYNKITQLDLSQNAELRQFSCYSNLLKTIDFSQNLELSELSCGQNKLSRLDISKNKELYELGCSDSPLLTQLDISHNERLHYLYVDNTSLNKLDISHNEKLQYLYIENTPLHTLDISHNKELSRLDCDNRLLLNSQFTYFTTTQGKYEITAESGLIVRERPTTKSQRLGKLEFNTTIQAKKTNIPFEVGETKDYWYEMEYQGKKGYVFGGFLEMY